MKVPDSFPKGVALALVPMTAKMLASLLRLFVTSSPTAKINGEIIGSISETIAQQAI
jgi:hypothetical protein